MSFNEEKHNRKFNLLIAFLFATCFFQIIRLLNKLNDLILKTIMLLSLLSTDVYYYNSNNIIAFNYFYFYFIVDYKKAFNNIK